jgi:lysozyme
LVAFTKQAEGFRSRPYRCPAGRLTIGYGANLEALTLTEPEAEFVLRWQLHKAETECQDMFPFWDSLSPERRMVLVDMAFNMGAAGLGTFQNMIANLARGDYDAAADAMHDSTWWLQVGRRAMKLARVMRTSDWNEAVEV